MDLGGGRAGEGVGALADQAEDEGEQGVLDGDAGAANREVTGGCGAGQVQALEHELEVRGGRRWAAQRGGDRDLHTGQAELVLRGRGALQGELGAEPDDSAGEQGERLGHRVRPLRRTVERNDQLGVAVRGGGREGRGQADLDVGGGPGVQGDLDRDVGERARAHARCLSHLTQVEQVQVGDAVALVARPVRQHGVDEADEGTAPGVVAERFGESRAGIGEPVAVEFDARPRRLEQPDGQAEVGDLRVEGGQAGHGPA
ncbi:MAG: hypothetical protein DLM58_20225 [Pseudonocardiales bacterium]|nr:MAG: hypothetical protein DLM58_20225 [Pseudonocardiales bacterium]